MTSNLYYFLIFFLDLLFVDNAADKLMPTFTFFIFLSSSCIDKWQSREHF